MSRIIVTGRIPDVALERLGQSHEVLSPSDELFERPALLRNVAGADAIVSLLTASIDDELLDAAGPGLQVVANVAVGYDNIDVAACTARSIIATNTPGVLTEATADIAFGLILMATRRLGEGERVIRSQTPWKWGMSFHLGSGLQGKTLGIIGMGGIGQATATRARAFGMNIAYTSRSPINEQLAAELQAQRLDLEELLATADVVSIHCPYNEHTRHLIGTAELGRMKPSAYLVNTARGPIIDEAALASALQHNVIAGAGLDVFEHEPRVHPELLALENVVLLPHLGSATVETRTAMANLAVDNALAVLAGTTPPSPINSLEHLSH